MMMMMTSRPSSNHHSRPPSSNISELLLRDTFGSLFERAKFIHDTSCTKEQIKKWVELSIHMVLHLVIINSLVYIFLMLVIKDDNDDTTALVTNNNKNINSNSTNHQIDSASASSSTLLAISYTHPISSMNDSEFQVYLGFFLWMTILFTGLGCEVINFLMFLPSKWSNKLQAYWVLAQSLFSLLIATAVGMSITHNYIALPLFIIGMWKFGFPQTITYLFLSLYDNNNDNDTTQQLSLISSQRRLRLQFFQRIGYYVNSIGLLIHHTSGGLAISMAIVGVINTSDSRIVLDAIIIAMMQHWFFFLKYIHKYIYIIVELVLEVWFEWITISNLEGLYHNHWTAALFGGTFLVAHWCFLIAGAIDMIIEYSYSKKKTTTTQTTLSRTTTATTVKQEEKDNNNNDPTDRYIDPTESHNNDNDIDDAASSEGEVFDV